MGVSILWEFCKWLLDIIKLQVNVWAMNIEKSELKNTFTVKLIVRHFFKWETFPRIEYDIK